MKALTLILVLLSCFFCKAQTSLTPGSYATENGGWSCNLTVNADKSITIAEPNLTATYRPVGNNVYSYVHTNGADYRVQAIDSKTFKVYHVNTPNNFTRYFLTGAASSGSATTGPAGPDYKKIAGKYRDKMKSDPKDAQMYAFCAAAAMARAMYDEDAFKAYAKKIVASLKQIVVNKQKCPCEDAISQNIWDSVSE